MARILWALCLIPICLIPFQGADLKELQDQCDEWIVSMGSEFADVTSFNNIGSGS